MTTAQRLKKFKNRQFIVYRAMLAITCVFAACVVLSFFGAAFGMSVQMANVLMTLITVLMYPALAGVFGLIGIKNRKKVIARLEERGQLELAACELLEGSTQPFTKQGLISDHFIFSRKKRGNMILCEDVLWIYSDQSGRSYHIVLGTRTDGCIECFSIKCGYTSFQQQFESAVEALRRKNPDLLVGDTPENKSAYEDMIDRY